MSKNRTRKDPKGVGDDLISNRAVAYVFDDINYR